MLLVNPPAACRCLTSIKRPPRSFVPLPLSCPSPLPSHRPSTPQHAPPPCSRVSSIQTFHAPVSASLVASVITSYLMLLVNSGRSRRWFETVTFSCRDKVQQTHLRCWSTPAGPAGGLYLSRSLQRHRATREGQPKDFQTGLQKGSFVLDVSCVEVHWLAWHDAM